jgi:hypothetical protein
MPLYNSDEALTERLRIQRNVFIFLTGCSLASIGIMLPRSIHTYHQQKMLNVYLVNLQGLIVENQQQARAIQSKILKEQQEIRDGSKK